MFIYDGLRSAFNQYKYTKLINKSKWFIYWQDVCHYDLYIWWEANLCFYL